MDYLSNPAGQVFMHRILPVLLSFAFAAAMGPVVIPALRRLHIGQTELAEGPDSHKKKGGTPTMGGVLFLLPALFVALFYVRGYKEIVPVLILTYGFGAVGFVDDYIKVVKKRNLGLTPKQKLLGQGIAATVFLLYLINVSEVDLTMRIPFVKGGVIDLGIFAIPAFYIIALATANGTNFTDGVDGLCGSVTAVVAAFYTVCAVANGTGASPFAAAFTGGLLGYLLYNVYPARVMMGDTGSLAIGGFVTGMAYVTNTPLFIPIVGFIYAIEVLSVVMQVSYFKATKGKRIFKMAPIHHHFELSGWSETRVVYVFSAVTILMSLIGYAALR